MLNGIDEFDADYFGMTPYTARMMDPQQRLFLQTAWHALEDSGYDPATFDGAIGVFASSTASGYLMDNLMSHRDTKNAGRRGHHRRDVQPRPAQRQGLPGDAGVARAEPARPESFGADRLFVVAGRRAPRLPEPAVRRMRHGAGRRRRRSGCRIGVGYTYEPGAMVSPSGHCRPFDAHSDGTIFGSGVAALILKPLQAALDDGDRIHAVIRGSAINNDGSMKMTYAAPAVAGQAEVIAEAHAVADVDASTIGFVETHGTGTPLGDPIEIEALRQAFELSELERSGPCVLGLGEVEHRPPRCGLRRHRPGQDDPVPEEQGDSRRRCTTPRPIPNCTSRTRRSWCRTPTCRGNPTHRAGPG